MDFGFNCKKNSNRGFFVSLSLLDNQFDIFLFCPKWASACFFLEFFGYLFSFFLKYDTEAGRFFMFTLEKRRKL